MRVSGARLRHVIPAGVAAVVAIAASIVLVVRPAGETGAETAAIGAAGSGATVLASTAWGGGQLVLAGRDATGGERSLMLAFVIDRGRGWRVIAAAEQSTALTDVQVGSMLATTSRGGTRQPAWSAVYGELGESRISSVEIRWQDDTTTTASRSDNAYLVVRNGVVRPSEARFLAEDGTEIAKVPIAT